MAGEARRFTTDWWCIPMSDLPIAFASAVNRRQKDASFCWHDCQPNSGSVAVDHIGKRRFRDETDHGFGRFAVFEKDQRWNTANTQLAG